MNLLFVSIFINLQYSCLENSTDRGAWRAIVHGVAKESDTTEQLTHTHTHIHTHTPCHLILRHHWLHDTDGEMETQRLEW